VCPLAGEMRSVWPCYALTYEQLVCYCTNVGGEIEYDSGFKIKALRRQSSVTMHYVH